MEDPNRSNRNPPRFNWHAGDAILREHIIKPWSKILYAQNWKNLPEIPNEDEICPPSDDIVPDSSFEKTRWNEYQRDREYPINLPHNIVDKPWPSESEYVSAHYQILREDSIAPLRDAVKVFKESPDMMEGNGIHIYTQVTIQGIQLSNQGAAFRVQFSNERAGKRIRWDQSKRLIEGTIVALTPRDDNFRSVCKIAVIAARPIVGGLDQNPPQVDICFGQDKDAVFAPDIKYVMVEAVPSYFESSRHILQAMQQLMTEEFPLARHLALLETDISEPEYVARRPFYNLCPLLPTDPNAQLAIDITSKGMEALEESLYDVNILTDFPKLPESGMDESQNQALKSMLTRKIAIIQGPPGTGKTFVSVGALKVLLANMKPTDPPIVVTAQTNHALDQLLNHVLRFEPNILRLGGRSSKENEEVRARTIYELRKCTKYTTYCNLGYANVRSARKRVDDLIALIQELVSPLTKDIVGMNTLRKYEIVSQNHYDSVCGGVWVNQSVGEMAGIDGFQGWLENEHLENIPRTSAIDFSLRLEDGEIEADRLAALVAEANAHAEGPSYRQDPNDASLTCTSIRFVRSRTGTSTGMGDREVKKLVMNTKDLHVIPMDQRGDIYRYWLKKLDHKIKLDLRVLLSRYRSAVDELRLAKWSANIRFIDNIGVKLVGCTTTGLSKYRGLVAALQPRTILIEEAAETPEGTIIAGMVSSLQQLILVGDHKQLQAICQVPALAVAPYNMNVSMFERLVNNKIPYIMLNMQRRMIPEIRKLLCIEPHPLYKNLYDHDSVREESKRPPVPGMGGVNFYFFHHKSPEAVNADGSKYNTDEAMMVVGYFYYLVLNGVPAEKITVLTFYNGQRKVILEELQKQFPCDRKLNCFTVDSFQGEENDVVLLSLVRSNNALQIGFLANRNRVVVALSRARCGFYMFGNVDTLAGGEGESDESYGRDLLWTPLLRYMRGISRFNYDNGNGLPLTCQNHQNTVYVHKADDFVHIDGGCHIKCMGVLPCDHACPLRCHPIPHEKVRCREPCPKQLPCGHGCSSTCGARCRCDGCQVEFTEEGRKVDLAKRLHPTGEELEEDADDLAPSRHTGSRNTGPSRDIRKTPHRNYRPDSGLKVAPQTSVQAWKDWKPPKAPIVSHKGFTTATQAFKETFRKVDVQEDGTRLKSSESRRKTSPPKQALKNFVSAAKDDYNFPKSGSSAARPSAKKSRVRDDDIFSQEDLYSAPPPKGSDQKGLEEGFKRMNIKGDELEEDLITLW